MYEYEKAEKFEKMAKGAIALAGTAAIYALGKILNDDDLSRYNERQERIDKLEGKWMKSKADKKKIVELRKQQDKSLRGTLKKVKK